MRYENEIQNSINFTFRAKGHPIKAIENFTRQIKRQHGNVKMVIAVNDYLILGRTIGTKATTLENLQPTLQELYGRLMKEDEEYDSNYEGMSFLDFFYQERSI